MKTIPLAMVSLTILAGCSSTPKPDGSQTKKTTPKVQITGFYTSPGAIPKGGVGNLCYGVESASKVELDPPVAEVWPAQTRCLEIKADGPSKYTLKATGADGRTDVKTVEIQTAEVVAAPELYDLWINALAVKAGEEVKLCFKARNAAKIEAAPGDFYPGPGCLQDHPQKTTTYRIAAVAKDGQRASRDVTVRVR